MTRSAQLARSVAMILASVSCASPRGQLHASDADSVHTSADVAPSLTLERGSCRGNCPAYTISLFADGAVRFTGTRSVRPIGVDSSRVSPAAIARLRNAFTARRFAMIPGSIEFGTTACGTYVADLPTNVLTLRTESGDHRVRFDEGCRNHPMLLDTLSRLVDSVSGSARWTRPVGG